MTDNIINDLEIVRYHLTASKHKQVIDDAIDLINRQQKDKENLRKNILKYEEIFVEQQEEINRLTKRNFELVEKGEAIKEFAKKSIEQVEKARQKYQRLCKEQGEEVEETMHIHFNGMVKIINNVKREMVGEDK